MRLAIVAKLLIICCLTFAIIGEEAASSKGAPQTFQAEVTKVLDILINSLYTTRAIFLREIISNASDALDKIRFQYLTEPKEPKNDAGEAPTMDIRIRVDKDKRTFYMRDGGVGMTQDDLSANLGSLGSSGTKRFLEKMKESNDANFIGQFGVGFYSVFLVSSKIKVASKHDSSDKHWVWESTGDGQYYLYEDPRGNTLGRGTELEMELKDDADEFLENDKIKEAIHKYSEFIHFPIFIETIKYEQVKKDKPAEDEEKKDEKSEDEEGEVKDEKEEEKKEEATETIQKKDWELVNENKPIWTRSPSEVTEAEYNKFYKAITKDYEDPLYYTHFTAEGEVQFKSILFIPGRAPHNIYDTQIVQANIRLYVRRVFITDEFKDLLPRYLNFVKGIVDSDDLPLNVSREVLQESRILKIIKKKLMRKVLKMIQDIADNDKRLEKEELEKKDGKEDTEEKKGEDEDEERKEGKLLKEVTYPKFYEEFGKSLKLGMIEDGTNRGKLTKLMRYKSSKSEDKVTSFEEYVDRMPESQKNIYFLAGESISKIKQSPVLEDALSRGVEVIYMVDAIDEYVVGHITDFSGKKLVNLAKDFKWEDNDEQAQKIEKGRKIKYEPLTKWFKDLIGEKVTKVVITRRKTSEPVLLSSPQHGITANMARIMKGQTLGEKNPSAEADAKRVLELNHLHPLVDEIFKRIKTDEKDKVAEDTAWVLFDTAALQNNFDVSDATLFAKRINRMLRQGVDIASDAPLLEEDVTEYEVEEEEKEDKKDEEKKEEKKDDEEDV
jgi:HSP90 family molecular chaperone